MTERKLSSTNYHNQSFLEDKCPLNELVHLLSKRWMTEVLFSIEDGKIRFNYLKEDLEHISDHILANRLKLLENYRLISKTYVQESPPRAEYSLTGQGTELSKLLGHLCDFAEKTMRPVKDSNTFL